MKRGKKNAGTKKIPRIVSIPPDVVLSPSSQMSIPGPLRGADRSRGRTQVSELTWSQFDRMIQALAREIHAVFRPDGVVGIAHGGVFVGAALGRALECEFYPVRISRRSRDTAPSKSQGTAPEIGAAARAGLWLVGGMRLGPGSVVPHITVLTLRDGVLRTPWPHALDVERHRAGIAAIVAFERIGAAIEFGAPAERAVLFLSVDNGLAEPDADGDKHAASHKTDGIVSGDWRPERDGVGHRHPM